MDGAASRFQNNGSSKIKDQVKKPFTYWYLATPYKSYPYGLYAAFELAVTTRAMFIEAKIPVFSPIIHCHPVAMQCGIDPVDHAIWLPTEKPILDCASGIIMLMATNWENSRGMNRERIAFEEANKPIVYMRNGKIPDEIKLYIDESNTF